MKFLTTIAACFIYSTCMFGAIDLITGGIKPKPNAILFLIVLSAFSIQLVYKKRLLFTDIAIVLFAILSAMGLAVFLSDLVFPPVAVAIDCIGHKPSRTHYYDIMAVGILISLAFGIIFIKSHKQKTLHDRIFSLLFIIVLILCYNRVPFFRNLNNSIDKVSRPTFALPKGC